MFLFLGSGRIYMDDILERYPKTVTLKGNLEATLRPLEASDEKSFHEFFCAVPETERLLFKHRVVDPQVIHDWCQHLDYGKILPIVAIADDRIVADLGGRFPCYVSGEEVVMRYDAGLLGHFATDTHAAVQWASAVMATRDGAKWTLPVGEKELAHLVSVCNGALFDALGSFENSVWGVKCRLTDLGLLPAPYCFRETGRPGQREAIRAAYSAHALLGDERYLAERLPQMKKEVGLS